MNAIRRDFDKEKVEQIIKDNLFRACDKTEIFVGWLSDLIKEKKAALWQLQTGWMIVSKKGYCKQQSLFLHCLEGSNLLNEETNRCLTQLALQENCVSITCETKIPAMRRILCRKFGFKFDHKSFNHWRTEQSGLVPLIKEIFVGQTKFSELKVG